MSAAVVIPAEIGPVTYKLTFKFGTIRIFEREIGKPLAEAFPGFSEDSDVPMTLDVLSALFWAALQSAHAMTREAADDLVDVAGMGAVAEWIGKGIAGYFGAGEIADEAPATEKAGNAPKKRRARAS